MRTLLVVLTTVFLTGCEVYIGPPASDPDWATTVGDMVRDIMEGLQGMAQ